MMVLVLEFASVDSGVYLLASLVATGTCIYVEGELKKTPEGTKQKVELKISAVAQIGNALSYATHSFFQKHGFLYVHNPFVTTSDCEGTGEMFQVTTLFSDAEKMEMELKENPPPSAADIESATLLVKENGNAAAQKKYEKASKEVIKAFVAELTKAKESLSKLEERSKLKPGVPQ
ncbi:Asparagine--tRNA ligase, cytoplasmic [Thalictrum thalictroides]|uniref:Asparagine--tRNA ligase, cytoplasmic n=1 Tax=Thalictrum thalictroides TaxID=46969 RepID=A0A7J6URZ9_THATH|nr:Asparagine--tRNA ligase, cytoplasmic [Thalictrum thalictroides]